MIEEQAAWRLAPPTPADACGRVDAGISRTPARRKRKRLSRPLVLVTVLVTQLVWFGALAYLAFRVI